ncbi:unnamed protein product [Heligmosomoides polygyrus]|uniref:NlpE_C domain-containing protein n=1 Tax=Heligmosomoides polygyrus TaxID=6339 RepID=A0A183G9I0_HELPZ|nr:unnamed protein product [Heligmosomoides polygyrus]
MIFRICLLLSAVACYTSAASFHRSTLVASFHKRTEKEGSKVSLTPLIPGQTIWERVRFHGAAIEFIKRCGPGETGLHCTQFVRKDTLQAAKPESIAYVDKDGHLVLNPMKATDVGKYYNGISQATKITDISYHLDKRPYTYLQVKK